MKRILTGLTLSAVLASPAWSDVTDETGKPLQVSKVFINLVDGASGGCWTNLGEVKTYASDKLALKGYPVSESDELRQHDVHYNLSVQVTGWRPYKSANAVQETSLFRSGP